MIWAEEKQCLEGRFDGKGLYRRGGFAAACSDSKIYEFYMRNSGYSESVIPVTRKRVWEEEERAEEEARSL